MRNISLAVALSLVVLAPAIAQTRLNSVNGPGPTFAAPYNNPAATYNGTYYPGYRPYLNPYSPAYNPYGYGYGGGGVYPYGYGVPTVLNNGYYRFNLGPATVNMWRSPSGYYYPWGGYGTGSYSSSTTILYAPQANTAPQPAQPPLSTIVRDMLAYLDDAKQKGRMSDSDYEHLRQRVIDLQSKEHDLSVQGAGSMDQQDEQTVRTDLDSVSKEITERIKPITSPSP